MELELPQGDCRKEHKEESEYKHTILVDGGCENQREFIDGSLNYERVPTDGYSKFYVGDIDIIFQNFAASQISHEHKYGEIIAANEEPRSIPPSPLELHEVGPSKKE